MPNTKTLPCFTPEQKDRAHILLAIRVAHMMGRKFEEGDWSYVYCRAKGIPEAGWSNLNIDVTHENLGVEHKMLCYRSDATLAQAFGTTLMHPAATRSIRIPSLDSDPNDAMRDILTHLRSTQILFAQGGQRSRNKTKRVNPPICERVGFYGRNR